MTHQEILSLIAAFDGSSLETLKLTQGEFSMEMTRSAGSEARRMIAPQPAGTEEAAASAPAPVAASENRITAPMVGTFYTAPAPDQPPFVQEGDRVRKGQTVGLIEAMKMMSEVTAPCECVIEQVLVNNAELVAFGTPLFSYKPC